jgi:hypothetical protein
VEGTSREGRARKRWRDVVEEDLNMVGIENRQAVVKRPSGMLEDCIGSQGYNGL